jgi:hypothetical protein
MHQDIANAQISLVFTDWYGFGSSRVKPDNLWEGGYLHRSFAGQG